ncbi:MAG: hypothetical protein M3409_07330, partial [Gemmatimonadota bacterium]|nr:hypothetical protein [Gemmatimonadota bacterium]
PPAEAAARRLPNDVHWFRNSAEQRALFVQGYRVAGDQLRELARGAPRGSWAVIVDADETVLDNSPYQVRRAELGLGFTIESWNEWVRERRATALPGSTEFLRQVREMGGRVAIVTNRDEIVCPETRENLQSVGVAADVVLCKPEGPSDKNPRFRAVEQGTAAAGVPPLRVLMYVGDNIQDFPGLTQEIRNAPPAATERFGRNWIMLPNPMYGSWERNPEQ